MWLCHISDENKIDSFIDRLSYVLIYNYQAILLDYCYGSSDKCLYINMEYDINDKRFKPENLNKTTMKIYYTVKK